KEEDLKKMSKDLEKKSLVLSDDVKLKKQQDLQEEMLKYRELVGKSQLEIQKKERELTMPIVQKLKEVIESIAKKEGYTMILEKSEQSVLWAKDDADLTDQVVKAYEKAK
ncbi:MAG: OmpH family outer membrane protein, partial [Bdellovibrionales bacterium]|nr:OmpH family outer membrane protein [Bdellovibrionales bacterium]